MFSTAIFFVILAVPAVQANIGLATLVAISPWNGVAIDGYDPVSYFTNAQPRQGSPLYEYVWRDAVWRFANEGNLAAFKKDPEVYAPGFGGFDPNGVLRGLLVKGDTSIFVMNDEKRLYLFSDENSRLSFVSDQELAGKANSAWEELVVKVVP
jgi:hypothetical protein